METNLSKLRLFYIIYGAICLFPLISYLTSGYWIANIGVNIVVYACTIGLFGWAAVKGKNMGINLAGRIGGWIFVALELISALVYIYFFVLNRDTFDYSQTFLYSTISASTYFLRLVALTLFVLCSKAWLALKLTTIIIKWLQLVSYFLGGIFWGYMGWSYSYLTVTNAILSFLLSTSIITLALVWRPRREA